MGPVPPQLHFPSPYLRPSTMPSVARRVETADGAEIASYVYGRLDVPATPVLFLHGNGEEHGIFGPSIDAVVAGGRAAIALDSRAQGKSTRGSAALSYELMAADALAVMDALGVGQAHLVGFSDGAIEGLLLARDHPGRVASLLSIGANLTPEGVIEDPEWDLAASIATNAAWSQVEVPADVDESLLLPSPSEAHVTAELLQLMLDEPHIDADSLAAISCPTTVMVGEFDCITPEETAAIHGAIGHSRLVVLPELDHSIPKHDPETVTRELKELIARAER